MAQRGADRAAGSRIQLARDVEKIGYYDELLTMSARLAAASGNTSYALASRLGLDIVAEGIETPAQLNTLQRMGCPYGQGYLLNPALGCGCRHRSVLTRHP